MQPALRPMNLGEILDRTFEIYRRHVAVFVGIAVAPGALMYALHLADFFWIHFSSLMRPHDEGGIILWSLLRGLAYYQISGFVFLLFLPAFVRATSLVVFGEKISVLASLRFILARWRSYLWLTFLKHLATLIIPEAIAFGVMFAIGTVADKHGWFDSSASAIGVIAVMLPIPGGIALFLWVGSCLGFAFPAAALEQIGGIGALRRSWRLSRGSRLRVVSVWMMVGLIQNVLLWSAYLLVREFFRVFYYAHHFSALEGRLFTSGTTLLYSVIGAFVVPIYPIAITLLYYDQRVRKEGLDLEMMMVSAELQAAVASEDPVPVIEEKGNSLSLWARVPRELRE